MIGVVARAEEKNAVEEFFELFKTAWEPFDADADYDVVLVTTENIPRTTAKLLIVFGSSPLPGEEGCTAREACETGERILSADAIAFPVYGKALSFERTSGMQVAVEHESEVFGFGRQGESQVTLRIGYDLFFEVSHLLARGQPVRNGGIPTLDRHIALLRRWMLDAGIDFVEIPPIPAGYDFAVCLTHDIDFVGIRRHFCDHTMVGFVLRATVGALRNTLRGTLTIGRLLRNWWSAMSLPLVYLGWARDFWLQFEDYIRIEKGLAATYYFIPFKRRPGENLRVQHPERRATAYDVGDVPDLIQTLKDEGCEVGVHGIDAWHCAERGREEMARVRAVAGSGETGIRMHWLLRNDQTMSVLENAGYSYDSTEGYNETVGYRCGTSQVYRPVGARQLLEVPMHIQDGALFYPGRLNLSESEAWNRCAPLIEHAIKAGGVLTVLWHDRSLGPERFWGDFYVRLVNHLRSLNAWFANAGTVAHWFRLRRNVSFRRDRSPSGLQVCSPGEAVLPGLRIWHWRSGRRGVRAECRWDGTSSLALSSDGRFVAPPEGSVQPTDGTVLCGPMTT